jgi:Fic family protein
MQASDFTAEMRRHLVKVGGYCAFVPPGLPPPITWSSDLVGRLSTADRALGQLAGLGRTLPNPHLLINPFLRREAVLSSQIEGTQASLSDLFLFEANPKTQAQVPDVREVNNYVRALEYGLKRVHSLPLSRRLLCELHTKLLEGVRGENMSPGDFRRIQVWIGPHGTALEKSRFVPPPAGPYLQSAINSLEAYLQQPSDLPPIIRLAAVHYQFETIHPFLDGNGRIGRLLIPLMLCLDGILPQPLLYLSAYFERHRRQYYDLLLAVSQKNAWNDWLAFFAQGVATEAADAVNRARRLMDLQARYVAMVRKRQASALAAKFVESLFDRPATTVAQAARTLDITVVAAQRHVDHLVAAGILTEVTGQKRNRIYLAKKIVQTVSEPTEA